MNNHQLTDAEIEIIAERAAEKAIEKVYTELGRSVANKLLWFLGVAVVGAIALLAGKEFGK